MADGYVRQSSGLIINGAIIQDTHFNNEYNAIEAAFDEITGHTHDGTTGGGAPIPLGGSAISGILLPTNGGTGKANNAASTITISGAYGLTITLTGATALTFPTSGTLVTTASKLSALAATTSAELAGVISDETGTGALVFANTPTLVTPVLGVATATSINKVAITAPATSATLTIADGKTLTTSNTLTFTGTDSSSVAFGTGGTVAYVANKLSVFAATTSSELAGVISDETGSGALVFANTPTLVTPVLGVATATSINGLTITSSTGTLTITNGKTASFSNSIVFAGTDSTTMTFPAASTTVAGLSTSQQFTKGNTLTPQSLSSSSNHIAWDASAGNNAKHTATENTTLDNPTNLSDGMVLCFRWKQHASSAKTLAFGSKWKFQGSSTVSTTTSSVQVFTGRYDSTDDIIETVMTGTFA